MEGKRKLEQEALIQEESAFHWLVLAGKEEDSFFFRLGSVRFAGPESSPAGLQSLLN